MRKRVQNPTLLELCRARGCRITAQRRIIAEVISTANDHPDVPEIHRRVMLKNGGISLATVYRTMRTFAEIGLIEQHSFDGGRFRVERAPNRHHDHLIDTETGKVIEFRSDKIELLQAEIARKFGYKLTGHRLELYGRPLQKRGENINRS